MGARKAGDISELCTLVQPDYAIFTGVCEQHIATFENLDAVWQEKSVILNSVAKKVVCGKSLRASIENAGLSQEKITYALDAENITLGATETEFVLKLDSEDVHAKTRLLGNAAVENIALAAALAKELGMSAEEIERGVSALQSIPHRLALIEQNGVYILDDGYNCNPVGAQEAIAVLSRFEGGKCVVTPGIVECGVLEEKINETLGRQIAQANLDKVILVGDTLVGAVKSGYALAGGEAAKLSVVKTLDLAQEELSKWIKAGDCVLFMNDLPDVYIP
jgi:UDP-N-acetylmuramoyl-tripeptide--D-alanyl-D-alanine ligase